jgi:hypothetical protein
MDSLECFLRSSRHIGGDADWNGERSAAPIGLVEEAVILM